MPVLLSEAVSEILKIALFLLWINFLPPLANILLGEKFARPLDRGALWLDNRPLLGPNKTLRGVFVAVAGGVWAAPLFGVPVFAGLLTALLVVAGDLATSFVKRRLGSASGQIVFGLDQFLESSMPAFYLKGVAGLSWPEAGASVLLFIIVAYAGSLVWSFLVYRTPAENYPRIIRSTVRLKEWRSCHMPQSRYHFLFNLENILTHRLLLGSLFRAAGLYRQGTVNALAVGWRREVFHFSELPAGFDNFSILFLSDLHLDGQPGLTDRLLAELDGKKFDLCILGGDYRMEVYGPIAPALRSLRKLVGGVDTAHGILGILGNHDCIEMLPDLEEAGVVMLVNDAWPIHHREEEIWVAGLDDPHYYRTHDLSLACRNIPEGAFSILVVHSPEAYGAAASFGVQLYLCGHTHGGQICLAGGRPLFTNSRAPRFTAKGRWRHGAMQGFTGAGVGASGIPLRFNCPGEIVEVVLLRGAG